MSKEVLEHLFEPFFTTKGMGGGTGLGLATVFGIVKQNDGLINVYSELGGGSRFSILSPSALGTITERLPVDPAGLPRGTGETVLLVEDDVAILWFLFRPCFGAWATRSLRRPPRAMPSSRPERTPATFDC